MGTKVTFETATFADAIKKANVVAPGRGKAFDEAGGIVLELQPDTGLVVVRATNNELFYTEWVTALTIEGDATTWRVPAQIVAPFAASLPIGTGKTISIEEVQVGVSRQLLLVSGRTKAKMFMLTMDDYPRWEVFDPDELSAVNDLGKRISLVEWCAGKDTPPLNGINFTGDKVQATDRYRVMVGDLKISNLPEGGVTVPAGILGQVLKQTGEVNIGFTESQMLIMPNDTTQIRAVLYDAKYPNMKNICNPVRPESVTFRKAELLDILNRATLAAPGDRLPLLRLFIGKEELAVVVDGTETKITDSVEVLGQATHSRIEIKLTPKNLSEVLQNAPSDSVTLWYDPANLAGILYLQVGDGVEAWVTARATSDV